MTTSQNTVRRKKKTEKKKKRASRGGEKKKKKKKKNAQPLGPKLLTSSGSDIQQTHETVPDGGGPSPGNDPGHQGRPPAYFSVAELVCDHVGLAGNFPW